MRVRAVVQPQQGCTYGELATVAQAAESHGFDGLFCSDHYLKIGDGEGWPGPCDSWTTIAGLARDTSRLRLGTLLTSATFRPPGPLALVLAQIDEMSGGRIEVGLGAGWYQGEHEAFGIPFPPLRERFDRLTEELEILTGMWTTPRGETFSFTGEHHRIVSNPALPKPVQVSGPPVIIGGLGQVRTPHLAARFAAEFNVPSGDPATTGAIFDVVRAACRAAGRDPASLGMSVSVLVSCGVDARDVARRTERLHPRMSALGDEPDDLERLGASGTPAEVVARLKEWQAVGADTVYLQLLDHTDLEHVRLLGEEVVPALA